MTNPNHASYLGTALQLQRWRDFTAHLAAYVVVNTALIGLWSATGGGAFWPAASLIGWGLGLSSQHWSNTLHGPITDSRVRSRMTTTPPAPTSTTVH